jgi:hypothetical protein
VGFARGSGVSLSRDERRDLSHSAGGNGRNHFGMGSRQVLEPNLARAARAPHDAPAGVGDEVGGDDRRGDGDEDADGVVRVKAVERDEAVAADAGEERREKKGKWNSAACSASAEAEAWPPASTP